MITTAAVLFEIGQPLRIMDLEVPLLKAGQVLVEVIYSGVCRSQLMEVQGKRGQDCYLPHLLGHEGSGVVRDVGKGVRKVRVGDHVVLTWIKGKGMDVPGPIYKHGRQRINAGPITTFSTYTVISENRCVPLPKGLPMDVACLFGCALLTGAGMILNTIKPDNTSAIAIFGAGGVGLSAIMAAKLCGCRVIIAVDVEESKLVLALKCGATDVVNAVNVNVLDAIRMIVGDDGLDYSVECSGSVRSIEMAFSSVRLRGGLCVIASHPSHGAKVCIDPYDLILGRRIKGSWGGQSNPDVDVPLFAELFVKGLLPIHKLITHRYPLMQINSALNDLQTRKVGRVVINMTFVDERQGE